MSKKRIGALVIGQTPRPDLTNPITTLLPDVDLITVGALDDRSSNSLPSIEGATYPLTTKLNNGRSVFISEAFIQPLLQEKLNFLEAEGVAASILLCAGTFGELQGKRPFIKPFNIGLNLLQSLNLNRIGLIAPFPAQIPPIEARWQAAGFKTTVWCADIYNQDDAFFNQLQTETKTHRLQAILLDYVGHEPETVKKLQNRVDLPVFDLGGLAISTLATLL